MVTLCRQDVILCSETPGKVPILLWESNWPCPGLVPTDLTHPGNWITVITNQNDQRILFQWHQAPFFLIGVLTWFLFRCDRVWNGLIPGGRGSRSYPLCGLVFMVNVLWELQTMTVDGLASLAALSSYFCADSQTHVNPETSNKTDHAMNEKSHRPSACFKIQQTKYRLPRNR